MASTESSAEARRRHSSAKSQRIWEKSWRATSSRLAPPMPDACKSMPGPLGTERGRHCQKWPGEFHTACSTGYIRLGQNYRGQRAAAGISKITTSMNQKAPTYVFSKDEPMRQLSFKVLAFG